jgi:hypothetical protein
MQNNLVVLDNDLIRASYRLTANEMRLVLCALAQIPKGEPIEPKRAYYVTKEDFVKLGVTPNNVARDIREACSDLLSRVVVLDTPIGELGFHWVHNILHFKSEALERLKKEYPTAKNDEEFINTLRLHNLLDSLPIIAKSTDNIVARIVFHENIIPYISQLKEQFTKLNLHDVFGFSSFYSFRFYLMMMQFRETGYLKISIDDLRKSLNLENKYKATKDFKVRVVDTAIDEINEKSPYTVNYEFIQKGRTYTHLELKFKEKKAEEKLIDSKRDPNTPDLFTHKTDKELAESNAIKQIKKPKKDDLEHQASKITGLIMSNQLISRFKQGDESTMQTMQRIRSEITSQEIAEQWLNKLRDFGVGV